MPHLKHRLLPLLLLSASLATAAAAQDADLAVNKEGPIEAPSDSDVTFDVTITNLGPDAATTISLDDPLPGTMTFVSLTADPDFACTPPAVGSGGTVTCTSPTMAAGDVAAFTFVFHIPPATPPGTVFLNIATVTSPNDPTSENNQGIWGTSTPPPPQGDVVVTKNGPSSAGPDTDVVYTITVVNSGPDAATNVSLTDTLPGTMTFVSLVQSGGPSWSCPPPAGTVTCTVASLPVGPGNGTTFTLTGHIPAGTPPGTAFSNTASVNADNDPEPSNDASTTLLTVAAVDLVVTKQGPPTAIAGNQISYDVTVQNSGPDDATNVQLLDTLPPGTTFVSATQDAGPPCLLSPPPVGSSGTIIACVWATLAAGAPLAQFTFVLEIGNTLDVDNTAVVTTESFDTDPQNNSSSVSTSVTPVADLSVTKTAEPLSVAAGDLLTYTITVLDAGPSDATTVSLTDTLPAGTTFVSLDQTGPAFSCTPPPVGDTGTLTCTTALLPVGEPATFLLVVEVVSDATGPLVNTATVASPVGDPVPDNNSSTTTTTVFQSSDLAVTKAAQGSAVAGGTVSYLITVTNDGPSDSGPVTLDDPLPPGTTFASLDASGAPGFVCVTPAVGANGTVTCTAPGMAAGETATFVLVLDIPAGATGTLINTATATTANDPTPGNDASTSTTTIAGNALIIPTLDQLGLLLLGLALALGGGLALRRRRGGATFG